MPHCAVPDPAARGGITRAGPGHRGVYAVSCGPVKAGRASACTVRQRLWGGGCLALLDQCSSRDLIRGKSMRRILFVLISAFAAVVMGASAALADSPHFLFATNSIDTSTGQLNTMFKEVGLGTGTTSVGITVTADATATYQCYNKAGNKPQGVPKTFGPSGVSGSANFPVNHGNTTGTAVAGPLSAGDFSCPSGQLRFLDAVSYSNIVITDQFGNSLNATPDPVAATVHIQF